jgi:hypothetical protein
VLLSIGLFSIQAALGQGTYQFTWHGNSDFFQASFEVTDAEMQPSASFGSDVFYNSILVMSVSGISYTYINGSGLALGEGNPFALSIDLLDFGHGTQVHMGAGSDFTGIVQERPFSGALLFTEAGFWTQAHVPEPSSGTLLCFGVAAWIATRRRRGRAPSLRSRIVSRTR